MHPIGIYIHVPYCASKCPYCDFHSAAGSEEEKSAYTNALVDDISRYRGQEIAADSVYFGGGTPTLLGGDNLCAVLDAVRSSFELSADTEITVEANPADDLYPLFLQLCESGVNRISMGLQSGVDSELALLGRRHSAQQAERAVTAARKAGINNLSLDLMLAIPDQTAGTLAHSVDYAAALSPEHISAYLLKIEEGTPFAGRRLKLPDDDTAAEFYELTVERLSHHGYRQYEISNFSRPGYESRHNLKYWNAEEYLGFGASSHGFFRGLRYYYARDTRAYIENRKIIENGTGGEREEYAMLRLRLTDGITEKGWQERFGEPIPDTMRKNARLLEKAGLAVCDEAGIRLTVRGFLLSNAAICTIVG